MLILQKLNVREDRVENNQEVVNSLIEEYSDSKIGLEFNHQSRMTESLSISWEQRVAQIDEQSENIILEVSKPLLRLLSEIPPQLNGQSITDFREHLENEIDIFAKVLEYFSCKKEHILISQYCLCTALDEQINQTIWGGGDGNHIGSWPKESLLSTFHKDSYGGDKVFLLIGKLAANPQDHVNVIELIYYILELGFEGRYRYDNNGLQQLSVIKSNLLSLIHSVRPKHTISLAPTFDIQSNDKRANKIWFIPIWLIITSAFVILLIQFSWYQFSLSQQSSKVAANIEKIGKKAFPLQVASQANTSLTRLLQPEIDQSILSIENDNGIDLITFNSDLMFDSGRVLIKPELSPVFQKISQELMSLGTPFVTIVGHSDTTPIYSKQFKNNQELSFARASSGELLLKKYGYPAEKIKVIGVGDAEAVADNATKEGKAKNRRIEMHINYEADGSRIKTNSVVDLSASN